MNNGRVVNAVKKTEFLNRVGTYKTTSRARRRVGQSADVLLRSPAPLMLVAVADRTYSLGKGCEQKLLLLENVQNVAQQKRCLEDEARPESWEG